MKFNCWINLWLSRFASGNFSLVVVMSFVLNRPTISNILLQNNNCWRFTVAAAFQYYVMFVVKVKLKFAESCQSQLSLFATAV
jgi:hypothetical protein